MAAQVTGGILLSELMTVEEFGLVLHTGHDQAARTIALGAHSVEIAEPTRWLSPGWIVITTGMRLRGNSGAQRELVVELVDRGMAGLGYASGVQSRRVPAALLEEGRRLDFPVFEIPLETAVVDVIDHVRRHALSQDAEFLQQMVDLHAHLMGLTDREALTEDGGLDIGLMRRLDALVGAELEFVDDAGTKVWPHEGRLPRSQIELLDHGAMGDVVTIPDDGSSAGAKAFPIAYGKRRFGWIIARWSDVRDSRDVPLIRGAANIASYTRGVRELTPQHVNTLQHAVLVRLLQGSPYPTDVLERAGLLGFIEGEPRRVVLVTGPTAKRIWTNLSRDLEYLQIPYLAMANHDGFVALMQGSEETLRRILSSIGAGQVYVGCSIDTLIDFDKAHESALFVQSAASAGVQSMMWWDDLPMSAWMIGTVDAQESGRRAKLLLAPLTEQPLLRDAIVAYLEHNLSVVDAAGALFLHPNSLRYRLSRVEKLLGGEIRQPAFIASLYASLVQLNYLRP